MSQAKLKRSHLGLIVVVGILAILMFILVTAVAILLFSDQLNAAGSPNSRLISSRSPLDTEQIDPALALASLGGVPASEVMAEAIEKARPETALAATLFEPGLKDGQSAGTSLFLARIYAEQGQREKSLFCYRLAGTIATLSPELPATVRADLFFQVSQGLMALEESDLARFYLDQAFILAARSPFLQVVHRRNIFEQLQRAYLSLGQRELARTSLDLSANPPDIDFIPGEGVILPEAEAVILAAAVQEAEATRWIRAQELAALLVERGGNAPPAAYEALREALLAEDGQKSQFYEAELATESQISKRIDLTAAKIEWLSIKYRVARRGFGLTLVPEWEAQAEQIRANLTKAYESLFALYADLVVALPTAAQIDRATEEKLRREVLAGELGRYPNYPEQQRQKQLLDMSEQLAATQPELNVFIGIRQIGQEELYTVFSPQTTNGQ